VTIPIGQPPIAPGATIYVSFSAEINVHTTESLIAAMANCANVWGSITRSRLAWSM
jgi:hypothetical protein